MKRFYDHIAQNVPYFSPSKTPTRTSRNPGYKRGTVTSKKREDSLISQKKSDQRGNNQPTRFPKRATIFVKPLPKIRPSNVKITRNLLKVDFDSDKNSDQQSTFVTTPIQTETQAETNDDNGNELSDYSEFFSDDSSDSGPRIENIHTIQIDKSDFPEIPPLATNLVQFLATIPDSAPPSLSPYTFCEEVNSLQGPDFEQFLEEDTLILKSAILGNRFNEDTIYDFFISLSSQQFSKAFEIAFHQYFEVAQIVRLIQDLFTSESIQELAFKIEQGALSLFGCRTSMLWYNIPSAKMLINHSRLMRYPHKVGLIGTAASEQRQVVAPNPLTSPLFSEEYDYPFCEDSDIILAEPIIDPTTDQLYGVLMLIDKIHKSGASYMYWPQSDLTLLNFFSSRLYRVFRKFNGDIKETSKNFRILAKLISKQTNFFSLLSTLKTLINDLITPEDVNIYFKDPKNIFWFETIGKNIQKKSISINKSGIAGYIFDHKTLVNCSYACEHKAYNSEMDGQYKSRSLIGIPLIFKDEVFSVIICRAKKHMPCFNTKDLRKLSIIALGASPTLNLSMNYYKRTNDLHFALRVQEKLASLLQTAESLSRQTSICVLVDTILKNACSLIGAERASLFTIDETKTHLISKVAQGTDKSLLLPINAGIAGHVATTGEIINIADVYEDSRFNSSIDKMTGYRTKSLLTIPVNDQNGNIIAVVQLMNKLNSESFNDSDAELAKAMSIFTGIALANSNVIESSILSTKKSQALLDTLIIFLRSKSVPIILHHIMNITCDLLQAERCAMFFIDDKNMNFNTTFLSEEERQISIVKGKGIVGYVAKYDIILNIPDAYKDKRFDPSVDQKTGYKTKSILAVPVKSNNKIVAVIELTNKNMISNGGIFTNEDEKLLKAFASFAGVAFDIYGTNTSCQSLAIILSNLISSEESKTYLPASQIMLKPEELTKYSSFRYDISMMNELEQFKLLISYFYDLKLSITFQINNFKLVRFLLTVYSKYTENEFYNWKKVVSTVKFVYYIISNTKLSEVLSKIEVLGLLIASICQDIDHSAINNQMLNEDSEIAFLFLYRNRPIEEIHHCEETIRIIEKEEENIFENIDINQRNQLWHLIISLILSTDMSQHFEIVSKFSNLIYPQMILNLNSVHHRVLLLKMVLKCASLYPTTQSFQSYEKWTYQLNKINGKNESDLLIAQEQIAFLLFIANPAFFSLAQALPQIMPTVDQLNCNLEMWKKKANDLKEKNVNQ
ncbi:3'5'-cyclic nucleotide phosphodiesterase family protein [Histomonas meleagridis]|uniref:3'5'-cyclic nucleotide phosphodiesterase family protein n=1 Tax=Histomonas meleagridis TaxID=135588 RepID=UPI00355A2049|nr:3'5'-cyclic nucleotide phosphodiesterase family protein [Histomonas meleagridis]KAH0805532.1 3'5'-cyclic nucleotide phosphodiesterase family protein [Histomonas meleagridis]